MGAKSDTQVGRVGTLTRAGPGRPTLVGQCPRSRKGRVVSLKWELKTICSARPRLQYCRRSRALQIVVLRCTWRPSRTWSRSTVTQPRSPQSTYVRRVERGGETALLLVASYGPSNLRSFYLKSWWKRLRRTIKAVLLFAKSPRPPTTIMTPLSLLCFTR